MSDLRAGDFRKISGRPKARTGVLGDALRDNGYRSVRHVCRTSGINEAVINAILCGRKQIVNTRGNIVPDALRFAEVLGDTPERLLSVEISMPQQAVSVQVSVSPCLYKMDIRLLMGEILGVLTDRERLIVKRYYLSEKTMPEIAREFCVTRSRVNQILKKSIRKLRSDSLAPVVREALDTLAE